MIKVDLKSVNFTMNGWWIIMAQKVFKRYELKFLINKIQRIRIEEELLNYMELDDYCKINGSYMIYNLYFDTDTDDIIRKSIQKPYYKEKLRLRCYKTPATKDDLIFLELKKKISGVVSKRRVTMTFEDVENFINTGVLLPNLPYMDQQVLKEITDFLTRYPAKTKVYLSYERTAYYGKEDNEFRVTIDKNILTRRARANFVDGDFGIELLDDGKYLMEVKVNGAIPLWLAQLFSELKIYTSGFSKYGEEYKHYAKEKKLEEMTCQLNTVLSQVFEPRVITA